MSIIIQVHINGLQKDARSYRDSSNDDKYVLGKTRPRAFFIHKSNQFVFLVTKSCSKLVGVSSHSLHPLINALFTI